MIYMFGDVHFREDKDKIVWSHNNQQITEFFKTLDLQKDDTCIFMGDVFDSTKHKGGVNEQALALFLYISSTGAKTWINTGNHETSIYSGNYLDTLNSVPNLFVAKEIMEVNLGMSKVLFIPHIEGTNMDAIHGELDSKFSSTEYDIVVGHHFFPWNALPNSPFLDLSNTKVQYKWWVMGHNHKSETKLPNQICTGSMWPCSKDQQEYDFKYLAYGGGDTMGYHSLVDAGFSKFKHVLWEHPELMEEIVEKDFYIVHVQCKKEGKKDIQKAVQTYFPKNLYEIQWEFEEEEKTEVIEFRKEDELTKRFFEENPVSKDVAKTFEEFNV
jgi:hypothetical protein